MAQGLTALSPEQNLRWSKNIFEYRFNQLNLECVCSKIIYASVRPFILSFLKAIIDITQFSVAEPVTSPDVIRTNMRGTRYVLIGGPKPRNRLDSSVHWVEYEQRQPSHQRSIGRVRALRYLL
ncbi:MAG: hypothetical protein CM1200mP18_08580 [Gammaproteobacteria bacterium]|nr:MAG: hypothetical protein CM1200mP18_08580 [Gammaproteobacteria bacterium]